MEINFSSNKDVLFTHTVNVPFIMQKCLDYYFHDLQKKGPRAKLTIYKHESDKNEKFLYAGNFRILSVVVVCLQRVCSPHQIMQRLDIFTKKYRIVSKIILMYPDFFSRLFVWAGQKHWPMSEKKTTGKPIKWIICFSPVLSKVFLQKSFTKIS